MLEKPETCEEAKKILRDQIDSDAVLENLQARKKQVYIVAAVGVGVVALVGIATQNALFALIAALPSVFMIVSELIPYRKLLRYRDEVRDGRFFEGKSDEEIINLASDYVDSRNKQEEKASAEA